MSEVRSLTIMTRRSFPSLDWASAGDTALATLRVARRQKARIPFMLPSLPPTGGRNIYLAVLGCQSTVCSHPRPNQRSSGNLSLLLAKLHCCGDHAGL